MDEFYLLFLKNLLFQCAKESGCCCLCALRHCLPRSNLHEWSDGTIKQRVEYDLPLSQRCCCCLGILQYFEVGEQSISLLVSNTLKTNPFQCHDFDFALSLPSNVLIRDLAIQHHFEKMGLSNCIKTNHQELKDVMRTLLIRLVEVESGLVHNVSSTFKIEVVASIEQGDGAPEFSLISRDVRLFVFS